MTVRNDWWTSFYARSYQAFHADAIQSKDTPAEVDQFIKVLQISPPAAVLDLGCGEGRHAIEFAARGYEVAGVDITVPMLEAARRQAKRRKLTVNFEQRDMRDLPWKGRFDAAYCVWGSFGVFDDAGNRDLVQAVFETLKPGGAFLIENHSLETLLPRLRPDSWQQLGDNLIRLEKQAFDHRTCRLNSRWLFVHVPDGSIETYEMSMRIYTFHELCDLLTSVGFEQIEGYDTRTGRPFSLGAERLTLVAAKPRSS